MHVNARVSPHSDNFTPLTAKNVSLVRISKAATLMRDERVPLRPLTVDAEFMISP
jgi:hypothetical protein